MFNLKKNVFFLIFGLFILIGVAILFYVFIPKCGDGICQKGEETFCSLDCDFCGDGVCSPKESCESCSLDCGKCKLAVSCGDGVCNAQAGECDTCFEDCSFNECLNGVCELEKGENCINSIDCKCKTNEYCNPENKKCEAESSCGNGRCEENKGENCNTCEIDCGACSCEEDLGGTTCLQRQECVGELLSEFCCRGECVFKQGEFPLLLIHGHSPIASELGINSLYELQKSLDRDNYYENRGVIVPSEVVSYKEKNYLKNTIKPIVVRTTYYLGEYDEVNDEITYQDDQHISVYADRIKNVVNAIKDLTGSTKVDIIAHSMGGLAAREYIRKYGSSNVNKLIMIGTPNHGIFGEIDLLCLDSRPECYDMKSNSNFLQKLNTEETIGSTKYMTVRGVVPNENVGCLSAEQQSDETVCEYSVPLEGATNIKVEGYKVSGFGTFHSDMINPNKVPEVYNLVVNFLKNN